MNTLNVYNKKVIEFIRGAFEKYVAWSNFSVTDYQTHSCLVSV